MAMNDKYWRKSYMLEFVENFEVVDCFTFSLPPKSEDFQFTQRVTETKTFNGAIYDIYGNDSVKITLNGSTVNEEAKFIYRGTKLLPKYLTGEREIFELQKVIEEWNDFSSIRKNKRVYLYDLSKMSILQIMAGTKSATRNYWRVVIKDLKIKRDTSNTNAYNYTLEMMGVNDDYAGVGNLIGDKFAQFIQNSQEGIEIFKQVLDYSQGIFNTLSSLTSKSVEIYNNWKDFENQNANTKTFKIMGVFDKSTRIITGNSNNAFYNITKDFLNLSKNLTAGLTDEEKSKAFYNNLYSKTSDNTYAIIRYNTLGGSEIPNQKVEIFTKAEKPLNPIKDEYYFDGWYTDTSFNNLYSFSENLTKDIILYAKWKPIYAYVRFDDRTGKNVIKQKVKIGNKIETLPKTPIKEGYIFDYWCKDPSCTIQFDFNSIIGNNITLYAKYNKLYYITFNSNGGDLIPTQSCLYGEKVIYPITPNRNNYKFKKWSSRPDLKDEYNFNSIVTDNLNLFAEYEKISNTVNFDSNGGSIVEPITVKIGELVTKPEPPILAGSVFKYWSENRDLSDFFDFDSTIIESDITLFAKFEKSDITVTFDTNGGSVIENQIVKYGEKATFPLIPSKDGNIFIKWKINKDGELIEFDFNSIITENITLFAEWYLL